MRPRSPSATMTEPSGATATAEIRRRIERSASAVDGSSPGPTIATLLVRGTVAPGASGLVKASAAASVGRGRGAGPSFAASGWSAAQALSASAMTTTTAMTALAAASIRIRPILPFTAGPPGRAPRR